MRALFCLSLFLLSVSFFGKGHAISAAYYESINQMEGILSSKLVADVIPPNECIVALKRKPTNPATFYPESETEIVYYIVTSSIKESAKEGKKPRKNLTRYRAVMKLSPNSMIGNPVQEVISIKKL